MIRRAELKDLEDILELQYLAYQSEAEILNDYSIPPLKQTLDEVKMEFMNGVILVETKDETIIGSVRGYVKEGTLYIGKLMVNPEFRRQGLGKKLLLAMEAECEHERCELFTSSQSVGNIKLYENTGYKKFKEKQISNVLKFVYLEK